MLQKIRTLAVQSANGTNTSDDRAALAKEGTALVAEITRIAEQTKFGGKTVLNGATSANSIYGSQVADRSKGAKMTIQVGANNKDEISFDVAAFTFKDILGQVKGAGGGNATKAANATAILLSTASGAKAAIDLMDAMISKVDRQRSGLGAIQNRLESSIRNQANVAANQSDARSRIRDADFAEESAALSQQSIIQQAATSMLMQANSRPQLALSMLG